MMMEKNGMLENNWFTDSLPYEAAQRFDSKWNVWKMTTITDDNGESDLKWQVIAVFENKEDAETFISKKV